MPTTLKLDLLVIPTYDSRLLGISDVSTYPSPPIAPTIEITIPGFGIVSLPFTPSDFNVFDSTSLGITGVGDVLVPIPDGVYEIKYSVFPAFENNIEKSIIRVDQLMEKFDAAFMKLDMMECDMAIKTQDKVVLNSIYYFINGAIAAANNCAIDTANKLYNQANKMLDNFMNNNKCGCSGNNYVINFH
jgi:hypothetical protein